MSINGIIYPEVGKHNVYYLSKVSHSSVDSLVDRGTNGGVVGNDVKTVAIHPDRTVDVRSIENHAIASILLVITCGVTLTTSGEVIVIMHQCSFHEKNKTSTHLLKSITTTIR